MVHPIDNDNLIWPWLIQIVGLAEFFFSQFGLDVTLMIHPIPLAGYSGTYPGITHPWVDVSCDSPLCQIVSGMYNQWLGRSESLWKVSSSVIYWCQLILFDDGVASDSKYVPKPCLTWSTNLDSTHPYLCCTLLYQCWHLTKSIRLDSAIRYRFHLFTSSFQYLSTIIHSSDSSVSLEFYYYSINRS